MKVVPTTEGLFWGSMSALVWDPGVTSFCYERGGTEDAIEADDVEMRNGRQTLKRAMGAAGWRFINQWGDGSFLSPLVFSSQSLNWRNAMSFADAVQETETSNPLASRYRNARPDPRDSLTPAVRSLSRGSVICVSGTVQCHLAGASVPQPEDASVQDLMPKALHSNL
jgi:hypothetical protein